MWQFFFPKSSTKMRSCLERKDQNSISNSIFTKHDKNKDNKAVTAARSSLAQQDSRNLFALVNGGQHLLLYECWMVILCVFVFVCVCFSRSVGFLQRFRNGLPFFFGCRQNQQNSHKKYQVCLFFGRTYHATTGIKYRVEQFG